MAAVVASIWLLSCGRATEYGRPDNDGSTQSALTPAERALNAALERDDVAAAARALQAGADPNANLFVGTVLAKAVLSNDPVLVETVLKAGANPNLCPRDTWCPMTTALHADHADSPQSNEDANRNRIAALLLRAGADPNGTPNDSPNPLQLAIERDRSEIATLLIDAGASVQGRAPKTGPLPVALKRGNHALVHRLLAAGATLDRDPELLEEIAKNSDAESLEVALDLMHKSLRRGDLTTSLGVATFEDCAECVRLLFAVGARYSLHDWFDLIGGTSAAVLDVYAAHGLDPRALDEDNATLLHEAAASGKADSVKWLLAHGVPVDAKERDSLRTPLMVAAEGGNIEAVKVLLDAGANPKLQNAAGKTPKALAAQALQRTPAHDEVVRLLQARGADDNVGDSTESS
jgi:ankyrin repeat protein